MLGVIWEPVADIFKFTVKINLSPLKNKARTGPDLSKSDLLSHPPAVITRRQYYSQIQSLFDPIGLLAPVMLSAKLLLRKTWEGSCAALSWDDPLPKNLVDEIVAYFLELFDLEELEFPRSIWPREEIVGKPDLVCFSDGSELAFGAAIYVRWALVSGGYWTSLIMSKSKIGPRNRITIPRMELNGAVMAKRLREFVVGQLDLEFGTIFHLVDSSTVLGYLHKADSRLKPYEGVRVSEVQAAGRFINGRLENWSWVETDVNPSDWTTKPRRVMDLFTGGFWQNGPRFLREDYDVWPLKHDFKMGTMEGELQLKVHFVGDARSYTDGFYKLMEKASSVTRLIRPVALMFTWVSAQSGSSSSTGVISKVEVNLAYTFWIKFAQKSVEKELQESIGQVEGVKIHGQFKRLSPFLDKSGIWRVGLRVREFTPFTKDNLPPAFLPRESRFTRLLMEQAHEKRHSGVEESVS